jgi:folate-binding protein YgfZ
MPLESLLRKWHQAAGATMGTWFGTLLPEHFTNLAEEYRFARESVALVDKNYRAWLRFTGPDRVRYLNALLTNNILALVPGTGVISLLLNPQGHILAEVETLGLDESVLAISYAMIHESLASTFEKFIIMDDVTMEDLTEEMGAIAIEGPQSPAVLAELTGVALDSLPELGHREAEAGAIPCRLLRRSPGGIPGVEFIAERAQLGALWENLAGAVRRHGGGPIGYATLNVLRLEPGIPWFSYDFDDKVIPHEAGLEGTHISFTKGCYTGQEIVERVRSRGHVNRRRVGLEFSGKEAPPPGTSLTFGGKEAGYVTRAAFSPGLGRAIGMGYLRREANAPGTQVEWRGGSAKVIEFPLASLRAKETRATIP